MALHITNNSSLPRTICEQENNFRESGARYQPLAEYQMDLVCRWRPDTTLTYVNDAFCSYHGRSEKELVGSLFLDLIPQDQRASMLNHIRQLICGKETSHGELRSIAADGSVRWHRWIDTPLLDSSGRVFEMQSVGVDITSLKNSREELLESERRYQHLAGHDLLTNLPNRSLLLERLNQSMNLGRPLAIFFADLDRFKQINDSLGSDFGDQVLCEMVRRLKKVLRKSDILARLNSDEFVLACEGIGGQSSLCQLAQRLLAIFRKPVALSGHTLYLSASIGVACFQGAEDPEILLRQADIAMYEAKRQGGNRFQFFSQEMQTRLEETFLLEKRMREGLGNRDFFVHYQPQIDLTSGIITGVEALVRWGKTPDSCISPEVFVKIAEDTGLIHQLGDFVLEEACAQNLRWQQMGLEPIQVTVNISAKQFGHPEFVEKVFRTLKTTGLDPKWLELEITESTIMDNVVEAIAIMKTLKEAGVRFAVDDFGTGYSSLNYLRQLSLSKLKIDRSFMAGVPGNRDNEKLVASILALARSFNLQTVAEGIETESQLAYLRQLDCRLGQGFLFSRPVAPEIIESLIGESLI